MVLGIVVLLGGVWVVSMQPVGKEAYVESEDGHAMESEELARGLQEEETDIEPDLSEARVPLHRRRDSSQVQLSPPAGFQIGLSPVSPGFMIVPRERGRRLSGLGGVNERGWARVKRVFLG